jgi:hypothetical protein
MTTPDAIISKAINKKIGLIKDFRGFGAVEINSHLSSNF